ncbi:reverse transcriptase domain-containing protein [Thalassospira sp.]|uniref:reverse transcriptase domain-containing protein n=1 Tax=Thalassospira sp. TaxID=1912094 RepID=UPI003AA8B218
MVQKQPEIWGRVTSAEALQAAWHKVVSNGGSAGGDGVSSQEFGRDLFANLTQLRVELLGGSYRSRPFKRVAIPKRKPGYRVLTIPSIRDRVVHTAIATMLLPILEPLFEDGSFAYRPGRGVVHAVECIERWRKQGYNTVIEADIVRYFDNVDQEILLEHVAFNLYHFAGDSLLSHKERSAERSGATVKGHDAVGRKTVSARRV